MVKLILYQGDALKILPTLESESIDLIITDPPYAISQKALVVDRSKWRSKIMRRNKPLNYEFGEWDIFETPEEFFGFTKQWLKECFRVLKDRGSIYSFMSKETIGKFIDWGNELGFKTKNIIVWHKTNPLPSFRKINYLSSTEFIWFACKNHSIPKTFNFKQQKQMHNFWESPQTNSLEEQMHPTQKPEALIKHLMEVSSNKNDVVLDPFLGSGTTMKVARDLNRNCIGIEINPEYIEITKKRLNWGSSLGDVEFEYVKQYSS